MEQKEWNKLKKAFPPFFTAFQKVIFLLKKKVHQYSSKLIGEPKVKELASKFGEEIKHMGAQELKQLFLSKVDKLSATKIFATKIFLSREDDLKETDKLQKLAEIAYEIGQIAMAIHESHKGMVEEVEFVLQLFVANSIFCGKVMQDSAILYIVEVWSNIEQWNMTNY
jgi:hypothetical protein